MANSNQSAFPIPSEHGYSGQDCIGLTKREYFAVKILSGMNANGMTNQEGVEPPYCMGAEKRVQYAILEADELLKQLGDKK
jgi:hypothetical protein